MSTVIQPTSAEELLRIPDDGFRYELVRGELRRTALAGGLHGIVAMQATLPLAQHVEANELGVVLAAGTGFKLATNPDTVRAPDAAFISRERIEQLGIPEDYWPGAPDLAVEVVSPSDTYTEVEEKVIEWLSAGTRMVIVADPRKRTVTVYRGSKVTFLTERDVLSGEDVVPGWTVAVKDLFA
jgi:Uma2 family endonuclease